MYQPLPRWSVDLHNELQRQTSWLLIRICKNNGLNLETTSNLKTVKFQDVPFCLINAPWQPNRKRSHSPVTWLDFANEVVRFDDRHICGWQSQRGTGRHGCSGCNWNSGPGLMIWNCVSCFWGWCCWYLRRKRPHGCWWDARRQNS